MERRLRKYVSKQKRRYTRDSFDLDLTFILPNLIAMGFPARSVRKVYRNDFDEFLRFLDEEIKPRGDFQIYNLCPESERDIYGNESIRKKVNNDFTTDDHNPPRFQDMIDFCQSASRQLDHNHNTSLIVHCKAGKGRTGVMVCILLLDCGRFQSAQEALEFYAESRTYNSKGITVPSQRRYVGYYEQYLDGGRVYDDQKILRLRCVVIEMNLTEDHLKKFDLKERKSDLDLVIRKRLNAEPVARGTLILRNFHKKSQDLWQIIYICKKWNVPAPHVRSSLPTEHGDESTIKVVDYIDLVNDNLFITKHLPARSGSVFSAKEKVCQFWINTCFVQTQQITNDKIVEFVERELYVSSPFYSLLQFDAMELDKIHKLDHSDMPDIKFSLLFADT